MKKILVGMSGGVDSSAAALILKNQGYEPAGCTLLLCNKEKGVSDAKDAESVCRKLGTEHFTLDLSGLFREKVMDSFAESYIKGETPNPCINCNRYIKFDKMLSCALELKYDGIATGHYAGIRYSEADGRWLLTRPADLRKDQTYVLYNMTQFQLAHTLFPLCGTDKQTIRQLAEENGLINARKPDSQDICFVPGGDYAGFIERHTGRTFPAGNYIDERGNVIGKHKGYIHYTIGQRKGLEAAFGEPMYVCGKNPADNTVTLRPGGVFAQTVIAEDVNLISIPDIKGEMRVTARVRYNMPAAAGVLSACGDSRIKVEFDAPVSAPAEGQALVTYDGDVVIGGGKICGSG